jgi:hypothetical protein
MNFMLHKGELVLVETDDAWTDKAGELWCTVRDAEGAWFDVKVADLKQCESDKVKE